LLDENRSFRRIFRPPHVRVTVQEAQRIEEQYVDGALDLNLPGTMEVINEARKTGLDAYMWGVSGGRPQRGWLPRLVAMCCAVAALTVSGLILVFVTSR
jgi:hypothetical protein